MHFDTPAQLEERRAVIRSSADLRRLADRIADANLPIWSREPFVPGDKALLSRDGGVCLRDGARLSFDPTEHREHRCPQCGRRYSGDRHYRAWVWRYHLWVTERTIHAALLAALGLEEQGVAWANEVLARYARTYTQFPNRDNVLGPSRLFFSTYLESIWLIQVLWAARLCRLAGRFTVDPEAFTAMVCESASLIASFDEGMSNRQIWNATALIAAGRWTDETAWTETGAAAIRRLLDKGVDHSGRWYEGENYHLFALRGFVFAAALLESEGESLHRETRLGSMYSAPLDTLQPDLTLPARGDSPWGVSVAQPRFAELFELGRTRTDDSRLGEVLHRIYSLPGPPMPTPFEEIAEVETNRPGARVDRTALGWKALAAMGGEAPVGGGIEARVLTVPGPARPAVIRPGPDRYVSLETSTHGFGHGHPDALHLALFDGEPWLTDLGTGSYVSGTLGWYRASLSHNVPAPTGRDQGPGVAWCRALSQEGEWAWVQGVAWGALGEGSRCTRSVIVGRDLLVDIVDVEVGPDEVVELSTHVLGQWNWPRSSDAAVRPLPTHPHADRLETGEAPPESIHVRGRHTTLVMALAPRGGERIEAAEGPGPPGLALDDAARHRFVIRRAPGPGRWVQAYSRAPDLAVREGGRGSIDVRWGGRTATLDPADGILMVREEGRSVQLRTGDGTAHPPPPVAATPTPRRRVTAARLTGMPEVGDLQPFAGAWVDLGERHYRRSETPYPGATRFAARVAVGVAPGQIVFAADVTRDELCFRPADAPDPTLDNEIPDIHSDGVECFFGTGGWGGVLVIPVPDSNRVRVASVQGDTEPAEVRGWWIPTSAGYALVTACHRERIAVDAAARLFVNVVVNEMRSDRIRRAGQLALSGGGWVYLRGDREAKADAVEAVWE